SDGTITFNSNFAFDYDRSNGVTPGTIDFESVATHEIGHALGFISAVDDVDSLSSGTIDPGVLDLFRFDASNAPTNLSQFNSFNRSLIPGQAEVFDDTTVSYAMSTGVHNGDGRQPSHWKDDGLTGTYIGVMDPTIGFGATTLITSADIRALEMIGYDVAAPEPSTLALCFVALAFLWRFAARREDPK